MWTIAAIMSKLSFFFLLQTFVIQWPKHTLLLFSSYRMIWLHFSTVDLSLLTKLHYYFSGKLCCK